MHHELPARLDLEHYRKDAKRLVRAYARGDDEAVARVEDVLAERARTRFLLSDAQYVIAREHGHRSWGDFKRRVETSEPEPPVAKIGVADVPMYEARAQQLQADVAAGHEDALRRVRAHVPLYAEGPVTALSPHDARLVVAREYGFPTWRDLVTHVRKAVRDAHRPVDPARAQGRAALLADDVTAVMRLLAANPRLADALLEDLTQPEFRGVDLRCAEVVADAAANLDVALNLAACFNHVALAELLLRRGASVDSVEIWGITPLETALYHASREAADVLAARKIVPYALWVVAALGRLELVAELFDAPTAGAHRPDLSKVGWPPGPPPRDDLQEIREEAFVHACHNARDEVAAWLLDRGVDIDARPYLGVTALHFAVQAGYLATVRFLAERGARLDLRDEIHGGTPLEWSERLAGDGHVRAEIRDYLAAASAARTVEPGLRYTEGERVRVWIRKRGTKYDIDDRGAAVRLAGKPRGWFRVAEQVVAEDALNVNRAGVVFVSAFRADWVEPLAQRIGAASKAVYDALLELDE